MVGRGVESPAGVGEAATNARPAALLATSGRMNFPATEHLPADELFINITPTGGLSGFFAFCFKHFPRSRVPGRMGPEGARLTPACRGDTTHLSQILELTFGLQVTKLLSTSKKKYVTYTRHRNAPSSCLFLCVADKNS